MAGEPAHAAELAVTPPDYVPILAILPVSPGAGAQDEASDDEALGLVSLLGQIRVVGAHFLSNEGPSQTNGCLRPRWTGGKPTKLANYVVHRYVNDDPAAANRCNL